MEKQFMCEALKEAKRSLLLHEVPVGAVIVKNNSIIARAHNLRETLQQVTAHAEILAIQNACEALDSWRLSGCDMYVTLEPCPMCAGAILQSRISKVYIGIFDPSVGACGSVINVIQNENLNHWTEIKWLYNDECGNLMTNFFKDKR
ncbi:nucleoside deaminase [Clostridium psychrophilum]|uniref:nucleoside deaminase n=1 Tax=Clostridium psychrophilum TaxID=132926 RepID=UPI001C0D4F04|nr:nucleoside deaminase [Clostridium psychrophilum]MBU3182916.1 nucleoside deaminase [Clostridium psychrophilum]